MSRLSLLAPLFASCVLFAADAIPGSRVTAPFDDAAYDARLDSFAQTAFSEGKFFGPAELRAAELKKSVPHAAVAPGVEKPTGGELRRRAACSTLMLIAVSKAEWDGTQNTPAEKPGADRKKAARNAGTTGRGRMRRASTGGATAFVVNPAGIVVTCAHAIQFEGPFILIAVTPAGRAIRVKEILLSDTASDLAFLRIDATDLPALPIAPDIEAGESVRVFGSPVGYYFTMTEGVVSRYSLAEPDENRPTAERPVQLEITADFAEGVSGAPVLDMTGAVVGVAQAYAISKNEDGDAAFKQDTAIPSREILRRMLPAAPLGK